MGIIPMGWAGEVATSDVVQRLVAGLSSDDCLTRRVATRKLLPKLLDPDMPFRYVAGFREEVAKADAQLRVRLAQVLEHLESWALFRTYRKDPLEQLVRPLSPENLAQDPKGYGKVREEYLAIVRNPEENIHARYYAGQIVARAVRSSPEAAKSWAPRVVKLLGDSDSATQIIAVGAILAGVQRERVTKAKLIRPLIQSLRDVRFSVRQIGQNLLEGLTGEQVCLDASDPEQIREPAIRQWETWWNTNRSRLERQSLQ